MQVDKGRSNSGPSFFFFLEQDDFSYRYFVRLKMLYLAFTLTEGIIPQFFNLIFHDFPASVQSPPTVLAERYHGQYDDWTTPATGNKPPLPPYRYAAAVDDRTFYPAAGPTGSSGRCCLLYNVSRPDVRRMSRYNGSRQAIVTRFCFLTIFFSLKQFKILRFAKFSNTSVSVSRLRRAYDTRICETIEFRQRCVASITVGYKRGFDIDSFTNETVID